MAAATVLARRVNRLLVTFLIPTTGWIAPDNLTAYSGGDGFVMEVGMCEFYVGCTRHHQWKEGFHLGHL